MNFKIIKSYAKINLSLGIIGKLKSGYHKIESLVSFINLYDEIKIKKINTKNHKIEFFGKFAKGIRKNNTIYNLLKILDKRKLLTLFAEYFPLLGNLTRIKFATLGIGTKPDLTISLVNQFK